MNNISKILLDRFQIRKTRAQKTAFIDWLLPLALENGYTATVEKGTFGSRNIVIGEPAGADVVFTAHYDTCARLPFPNFITPKSLPVFLLTQLAMTLALMLPALVLSALSGLLGFRYARVLFLILLWLDIALMLFGPANRHTANDNTSGVAAVLTLMQKMPEELRGRAAFVLFDLEETGLFGSASFAKAHKADMKEKLLINFDCVSDGNNILLVLKKDARKYAELLRSCYAGNDRFSVEVAEKGAIYPSDQANFPCGVGVAALKKTRGGLLYIDRVHTARDTQFSSENIDFLADASLLLTEKIRGQ